MSTDTERAAFKSALSEAPFKDSVTTYELNAAWWAWQARAAIAQQPAPFEPATLADVLDALNVFNKPRPGEGDEPWTEDDFISVKHLPDFINIIAVAWFSQGAAIAQQPAPRTQLSDRDIDEAAHELQRVIYECGGEPSERAYDYLRGILSKLPGDQ
jgi:hypothetical protein